MLVTDWKRMIGRWGAKLWFGRVIDFRTNLSDVSWRSLPFPGLTGQGPWECTEMH